MGRRFRSQDLELPADFDGFAAGPDFSGFAAVDEIEGSELAEIIPLRPDDAA